MQNNNVVLDIDGVLFDFERAFCKKFGWENRHFTSLEKRYPDKEEEIQWFVNSPSTYKNLDIVPLGVNIAKFCEKQKLSIRIVSSRPNFVEGVTGEELRRNKIPFFSYSVGNKSKLWRICAIDPLFVIDDQIDVAMMCANLDIPCFLVDQPWNQTFKEYSVIYRINRFHQFLEKYEQLTKAFA